jgi:hypothetical protein
MMTNRVFRYEIIALTLLLPQASVVPRPLLAMPYQQAERKNSREQDRLLSGPPFSLEQILGLLDVHPDRLSKAIDNRGLTFKATPENLEALRRAGASAKLIELIQLRAPYKPVVTPKPTPPAGGNLVLKCSPAECNVSIDGKLRGSTANGILQIKGLPPKQTVVDFEKDGYIGVQKTIAIAPGADVSNEVRLEPSEATKTQFGADLLSMTVQALGGDPGLADVASLSASGAAVVWNKDGQRTDWTFNTLLKLPKMVLFDLESSSGKFWVSLIDDKYKSGGDRSKLGGLFGGSSADKSRPPGIEEFDTSLRLFRDFQVSALIGRMRGSGYRVSADSGDPDDQGQFHLRSAGNAETYEVTLGREKLPILMKYESELGLGTGLEIVYSDYVEVGKGKYPSTTEIKLADAPHHGIEIKLETVMLAADLREKDFNGRFKPKK